MTFIRIRIKRSALYCLVLVLFGSGCLPGKKQDAGLTSEPSIERALETLRNTPSGNQVTDFLHKKSVLFEYSNTPGRCHKFSLRTGRIFLPRELKDSDTLLILALARAAYIYRLSDLSGLEELVSEEEEMGALFQARVAVELGLTNADLARDKFARELRSDLCAYLMEGSGAAALAARNEALSLEPDCQRPLETLQSRKVWLDDIREAINNDSFFQLLYERDRARVRKGIITMNTAMKNEAAIKALPTYEIYRYQRSFYDKQSGVFSRIEKLYRDSLREDEAWRRAGREAIDRAREEFSGCGLP